MPGLYCQLNTPVLRNLLVKSLSLGHLSYASAYSAFLGFSELCLAFLCYLMLSSGF